MRDEAEISLNVISCFEVAAQWGTKLRLGDESLDYR